MKVLNLKDDEFPKSLKEIKNPPTNLYLEGNFDLLNDKGIAIIGSRKCTEIGSKNARKFAYELASSGFTIISGMALGIDTAAHLGALDAKGKTIAVLGSGFNHIYPKENIELYEKILENDGLIISEYEPNTEACPDNFRKRNRLVSGLSQGVLVIEAAEHSGTGITIKYARQQKRPIFGIPSGIENPKGVGTNRLLKKDGILVTSVEDILKYFKIPKVKQISFEKYSKTDLDIKEEYLEIYNCMKSGVENINEISRKLNRNVNEINSLLLLMEIEGLIKSTSGNCYKINI